MIKWVLFACNHLPFPFFQDYIILDEGHKIKNTATKTAKNLRLIPAKHHFILTGTPVQNNLRVSRYIWNSKYFGKSFQYDYCFCLFLFFFFCDSRTQKRDKESNRTQENSARDTNVTDNQTEYRENSARGTNVTNNQTEHRENIARDTNVTDNQTEHRGNIARDTNVVTNS